MTLRRRKLLDNRRAALGAAALVAAVTATGWFMQGPSENANAHYALVRAIAQGTPVLDETRHEVGDLSTVDVSYVDGHYYSQKAPGLALASLPAYAVLRAAGAAEPGDPTRALWFLGMFALVLPAAGALVALCVVAERHAPRTGAVAAVTVALGTLMLPFAGLYHAHVLSASLGFAAFALLHAARGAGRPLPLVAVSGLLVGFATTTEYTLAIAAAVLAVYAAAREPRVRRLLAFGAGALLGVVPLLAYNTWAFGSPFQVSYTGAVEVSGSAQQGDVISDPWSSFFEAPSMHTLAETLFLPWGLITGTPVVAVALAGIVSLVRRSRADGLAVAGVVGGFLLFFLVFYEPSGFTFAPRYLVPMLPFLGLGLAAAFQVAPLVTATLAAASVVQMTVVTASRPLAAWDGRVWERLASRDGHGRTVLEFLGITGWHRVLPFFVLALAAAAAAWTLARPVRATRGEAAVAVAALCAWLALLRWGDAALSTSSGRALWAAALTVGVAAVTVVLAGAATRLAASRQPV